VNAEGRGQSPSFLNLCAEGTRFILLAFNLYLGKHHNGMFIIEIKKGKKQNIIKSYTYSNVM